MNSIDLHSNILFFSINVFNSSSNHVIVFVVFYYCHCFHSGRSQLMMAVNAMGGGRKQKSGKIITFHGKNKENACLKCLPYTNTQNWRIFFMIGCLSSLPFWSTDVVPAIRRQFLYCSLKKYFAGPQQEPTINQRSKRLPYTIIKRSDMLMKDLKCIITSFWSIVVNRSK